jgi:hypothetical protein
MAAAAAVAAVATTAATKTRMVVAGMVKARVMVTAATSLPWLKLVHVGRWREDGDE